MNYRSFFKNPEAAWGTVPMSMLYFTGELLLFSDRKMHLIQDGWLFSPRGEGVVNGAMYAWPNKLINGYEYSFEIYFKEIPHFILIDDNIVWDASRGEVEDTVSPWGIAYRSVRFTYIPDAESNGRLCFVIDKRSGFTGDTFSFTDIEMKTGFCWRKKTDLAHANYKKWEMPPNVKKRKSKTLLERLDHFHNSPAEKSECKLKKATWPAEDMDIIDNISCEADESSVLSLTAAGINGIFIYPDGDMSAEQKKSLTVLANHFSDIVSESKPCGDLWGFAEDYRKHSEKLISKTIAIGNFLLRSNPSVKFHFWLPEVSTRQWEVVKNPRWNHLKQLDRFQQLKMIIEINKNFQKEYLLDKIPEDFRARALTLYQTAEAGYQMAYYYKSGADLVMNKIIHRQNANIVVANTRGAATAYGKKFALEYDPWCGVHRFSHHPDEYEQILRVYYFAGANSIYNESHFKMEKGELNQIGKVFYDAIKFMRRHPVRGKQNVNIGVLRGWGCTWGEIACEATAAKWSYRPDKRHPYQNLDSHYMYFEINKKNQKEEELLDFNLLDVFFPSYGCYWRTRLRRLGTGTPYGQVDFLPWETNPSILYNYKMLIYLGLNGMDKSQAENLMEYVENGGTIIMALGQWRQEGRDPRPLMELNYSKFLGADIERDEKKLPIPLKDGQISMDIGREKYKASFSSAYKICPSTCRVIGEDDKKNPIAICNNYGKGKVYFFATEYLSKVNSRIMRKLISWLAKECKVLEFSKASDWLEYFVWHKNDIFIFPVFNHGRIKYPSGIGKDYGVWFGNISIDLEKIYGPDIPEEMEAFIGDMTEDVNLVPAVWTQKDNILMINMQIDRRTEIIIGPKGKTEKQFLGL